MKIKKPYFRALSGLCLLLLFSCHLTRNSLARQEQAIVVDNSKTTLPNTGLPVASDASCNTQMNSLVIDEKMKASQLAAGEQNEKVVQGMTDKIFHDVIGDQFRMPKVDWSNDNWSIHELQSKINGSEWITTKAIVHITVTVNGDLQVRTASTREPLSACSHIVTFRHINGEWGILNVAGRGARKQTKDTYNTGIRPKGNPVEKAAPVPGLTGVQCFDELSPEQVAEHRAVQNKFQRVTKHEAKDHANEVALETASAINQSAANVANRMARDDWSSNNWSIQELQSKINKIGEATAKEIAAIAINDNGDLQVTTVSTRKHLGDHGQVVIFRYINGEWEKIKVAIYDS